MPGSVGVQPVECLGHVMFAAAAELLEDDLHQRFSELGGAAHFDHGFIGDAASGIVWFDCDRVGRGGGVVSTDQNDAVCRELSELVGEFGGHAGDL
jgi:hypothetical protein